MLVDIKTEKMFCITPLGKITRNWEAGGEGNIEKFLPIMK